MKKLILIVRSYNNAEAANILGSKKKHVRPIMNLQMNMNFR